jgi:hypothetical protein
MVTMKNIINKKETLTIAVRSILVLSFLLLTFLGKFSIMSDFLIKLMIKLKQNSVDFENNLKINLSFKTLFYSLF